ncbi:MAG: hypothetical protein ACK55I_21260, partial [bacterium]
MPVPVTSPVKVSEPDGTSPQDGLIPSVVRYLPLLLVCDGRKLFLTAEDGVRTSDTCRYCAW